MRDGKQLEVGVSKECPTPATPEQTQGKGGKPGKSGPPGNKNAQKHGLYTLKGAINTLGKRAMDRRTTVAKALAEWRRELLADLGGISNVSTQELQLVDLAVKTKLMLDSVDAWLLTQKSLVNHRKRALLPAVKERTQLADALARYLDMLGLKRRKRALPDLRQLLAAKTELSEPTEKNTEATKCPDASVTA